MFMRSLERGMRRALSLLDAAATRLYGWARNPLHQSGTIAVVMLVLLVVTGTYLVVLYRPSAPAESVARMAADPWLGRWMRSLHRYATDVFIIAALLHMFRIFAQARSWGPRARAWISGVLLFGTGLFCAWTGFVMAWDTFGERLAREGARLLDVLPIFSEPLSRIFAGDGPVPSAFFFVNMFAHIGLPLAIGAMLWFHVSHLARPVMLPPRSLSRALVGVLMVASVLMPATLGEPASAFRLPSATPLDVVATWWLPLSERLAPVAVWALSLMLTMAVVLVPRMVRRTREGSWAPSVVDPRLCTGCNQCPQDCPWEAITMVKRDDDRPTLVALVDPALCVSCGICAGSCAPMGVGPPGRTGRDQLSALRSEHMAEFGAAEAIPIVAVCCEQAPAAHAAALRARGAHIHAVSCVGNLHTSVVERFLQRGAPGVFIGGCPPRDCVGREGPKWLHERVFNDREAELQARVDRRRVRVVTLAAGALDEALEAFGAFEADVALLETQVAADGGELELVCEPVPLDETSRGAE
jgi:ferredoxin